MSTSNTARKFRFSYAGIGSRRISQYEAEYMTRIASKLREAGGLLYSGNAEGSDTAFQFGSSGDCVVFLPWRDFNKHGYWHERATFIVPTETKDSSESVAKYHPKGESLTQGARKMMLRNYHQVMGYADYPQVKFVVCCADFKTDSFGNIDIIGGTGQACRIAKDMDIPIINIRVEGWKIELEETVRKIIRGNNDIH